MAVKSSLDFRLIVESELGRAKSTGKAWNFKCPFHHEEIGASLAVYQDGWRCFGKCKGTPMEFGDPIDWFRIRHGMTFKQACEAINVDPKDFLQERETRQQNTARPPANPPSRDWIAAAHPHVEEAEAELWKNQRALAYLIQHRGFTIETIRQARFGFNPSWQELNFTDPATGKRARLAPGIVIPWYVDGVLWSVKVRLPVGKFAKVLGVPEATFRNRKTGNLDLAPKYLGVPGGSYRGCYNVDALKVGDVVLITEGEFDARIAQQCCPWLTAVTLGSANNSLPERWRNKLLNASYRLLGLDRDTAGNGAKENLLKELPDALTVDPPDGVKDWSDLNLKAPDAVHNVLVTGGFLR